MAAGRSPRIGPQKDTGDEASSPGRIAHDLPLVDGIEATGTLRRRHPTAPRVLVLTAFADDENVVAALHAGADGFLPERARPAGIVDAVRVVARGESLLFPAAIRLLAARHESGGTVRGVPRVALTDRETDVLRLRAHRLSNGEIATELFLALQTVKSHVSSLLRKLGARDRTQAAIAAYESGLCPCAEAGPDCAAAQPGSSWPAAQPKAGCRRRWC